MGQRPGIDRGDERGSRRRIWARRALLLLAALIVYWLVAVLLLHTGQGSPSFGTASAVASSSMQERIYEHELVGQVEQCLPIISVLSPVCAV
jgi:peptidoglycan/LPS O-acetylase OafA/YrhL